MLIIMLNIDVVVFESKNNSDCILKIKINN